jgi:hypothetical protein
MFNTKLKKEIVELKRQLANAERTDQYVADLKAEQKREIETLEHKHAMKVKDLEFDFKNFKDTELLKAHEANVKLTNKNDVLTKENEMMKEMVDINADIVDVKDIINKLIDKLPEVNLKSLTVNTNNK